MRSFIFLIAFVLPVSQLMVFSCKENELKIKRKSGKIECEKCEGCPAGEEPVPACGTEILNIEGEYTKGCRICSKGMFKESTDGELSTKNCKNCSNVSCSGFREIKTCNVYNGPICHENDCDLEHYKQNGVCKKCCQCEGSLKVESKCRHPAKRCSSDEFDECADLPRTTTMASTTLKRATLRTTKGRTSPGHTNPATSTETKIPGTSAESLSITTQKRIASTLLFKTTPYTQKIRLSTALRTRKTTKKNRTGTSIIFPSTSFVAKDTSTSKTRSVVPMSRDGENSRHQDLPLTTVVVLAVLAVIVIFGIPICLWCSRKKDLSKCFLGRRGGDNESGKSDFSLPLNKLDNNGSSFPGEGSGTAPPTECQNLLVNTSTPEGDPPTECQNLSVNTSTPEGDPPTECQNLLVNTSTPEGAPPTEGQNLSVNTSTPEGETDGETLTQKIEVKIDDLLKLKQCCECGAKADQSIDDENRNIGAQIQQLKLYKKDLVEIYRYITGDYNEIEINDGWFLIRDIVALEPKASCAQLLGALQLMGKKGELTRCHKEFHNI